MSTSHCSQFIHQAIINSLISWKSQCVWIQWKSFTWNNDAATDGMSPAPKTRPETVQV